MHLSCVSGRVQLLAEGHAQARPPRQGPPGSAESKGLTNLLLARSLRVTWHPKLEHWEHTTNTHCTATPHGKQHSSSTRTSSYCSAAWSQLRSWSMPRSCTPLQQRQQQEARGPLKAAWGAGPAQCLFRGALLIVCPAHALYGRRAPRVRHLLPLPNRTPPHMLSTMVCRLAPACCMATPSI
jgi:hypothetical protein